MVFLVTPAEKGRFDVGDNEHFKTLAISQVMSEKTEKALVSFFRLGQ